MEIKAIITLATNYWWFGGLLAIGIVSFLLYRLVDILQARYVVRVAQPQDLEKMTPEIYKGKQLRKGKRSWKSLWKNLASWLLKFGFILFAIPVLVIFLHQKELSYGSIYFILIIITYLLNILTSRLFSLWAPAPLAVDYPASQRSVWRPGNLLIQACGIASWAVPVYFLWEIFKTQGWIGTVVIFVLSQVLQLLVFIAAIKKQAVPYRDYPGLSEDFKQSLHQYLQSQGLHDDQVGILAGMKLGPNAFATGLFGYRQIIITEELITGYVDPTNPNFTLKLGEDTIEAIIAHEVGHLANHHIEKALVLGTLITSLVTVAVYYLFSGQPDHYLVFEATTTPQILLYWGQSLFNIMLIYPLTFLMLYNSRRNEWQADTHLLETNGCKNGQDFFHQIRHIAPVPNHSWWHACNMTHPDPAIREKRMIEWSEEHCH